MTKFITYFNMAGEHFSILQSPTEACFGASPLVAGYADFGWADHLNSLGVY